MVILKAVAHVLVLEDVSPFSQESSLVLKAGKFQDPSTQELKIACRFLTESLLSLNEALKLLLINYPDFLS